MTLCTACPYAACIDICPDYDKIRITGAADQREYMRRYMRIYRKRNDLTDKNREHQRASRARRKAAA